MHHGCGNSNDGDERDIDDQHPFERDHRQDSAQVQTGHPVATHREADNPIQLDVFLLGQSQYVALVKDDASQGDLGENQAEERNPPVDALCALVHPK